MLALKVSPPPSPTISLPQVLVSEVGKQVSQAVYLKEYYRHPDFSYEWNNGVLEEMPMADFLSFQLYAWFFELLREYLRVFPKHQLTGHEIGFSLNNGEKLSIRKPDLAVISADNSRHMQNNECSYKGIYDLCIEFLSDSTRKEIERDTLQKKAEYSAAGVREYFILDRLGQHTAFYRLDEQQNYRPIEAKLGVIRSQVLPGFAFRLNDLEAMPAFESIMYQSVYQPFLLKVLQQERAAKEKAFKHIEHLENLLRQKGVNIDGLMRIKGTE